MAWKVRWIARQMPRFLMMTCIAATLNGAAATALPRAASAPSAVATDHYPQVRIRKLHLVRPDLIFYPVEYDVYC